MPHPCPHHCPPEHGGKLALAVVVLVLIIAAAVARPAEHAAEETVRVAVDAAEIAGITLGAGIVLAVAVMTAMAVRARRRDRVAITCRVARQAGTGEPAQAVSAPGRAAIEAPRQALADVKSAAARLGYEVVPRSQARD